MSAVMRRAADEVKMPVSFSCDLDERLGVVCKAEYKDWNITFVLIGKDGYENQESFINMMRILNLQFSKVENGAEK